MTTAEYPRRQSFSRDKELTRIPSRRLIPNVRIAVWHEDLYCIKTAAPVARARKGEKSQVSTYVAKVYKKAAQIADLMTGEDVEEDLRVLREARHAVHHIYDQKQKCLIPLPDHKTRLAATTLSRAYHEGKPIERTISASGDFEDLQSLLEAMKHSPASQASLQKAVDWKEVAPALPAS